MRIPGLATGMDTESIVKDMMMPYRVKIDRVYQDKMLLQYKQELYRDYMKEAQGFYNKYFDINSKDSLMMSSNWETVKFDSSDSFAVSATGTAGAKPGNYKVKVDEIATAATGTISDEKFNKLVDGDKISIVMKDKDGNNQTIEVDAFKDGKRLSSNEIVKELNAGFKEKGLEIEAEYSQFSKGINLKTKGMGKDINFTMTVGSEETKHIGTDSKVTITNSVGHTYEHTGNSNTVVLDGVKFEFKEKTDKEVTLSGKTDVSKVKDTIINFVNDYNALIEKTNKLVMDKNDRNYKPLTEEQKKDMTKEEIELWEKKAKTGLLRSDNDLTRINNKLKETMRSMMGGLNLEKIGITPVADYSSKSGMFIIDEAKLTEALEKNPEEVKNLFVAPKVEEGENKNAGGIMTQMKDILFKEVMSVDSSLMKKAGLEGSVTAFNNTLTKQLQDKEKMIAEMEREFSRKEQNAYSKWARLETQMNALNSQSAYLMQAFGGGM
ncbi:MAG: flagellar filament capping protein FliD [Clostridium sp.]